MQENRESNYHQDPQQRPEDNRNRVRGMVSNNLNQGIQNSKSVNIFLIAISCSKLAATLFIFLYYKERPTHQLRMFLWAMFGHDFLNIIYLMLRIQQANHIQLEQPQNIQADLENPLLQSSRSNARQENDIDAQQENPPNEVCLNQYNETLKIIYFALIVLGHVVYFGQKDTVQSQDAPKTNVLALTYLIMGYINMCIPLLIVCGVCLCLPVVFLIWYFFARRSMTNPATAAAIQNLPTKTFGTDTIEGNECAICLSIYVENEQIVQLSCSQYHHFHAECIKRWLVINGECPICRKRIDAQQEVQQQQQQQQQTN